MIRLCLVAAKVEDLDRPELLNGRFEPFRLRRGNRVLLRAGVRKCTDAACERVADVGESAATVTQHSGDRQPADQEHGCEQQEEREDVAADRADERSATEIQQVADGAPAVSKQAWLELD